MQASTPTVSIIILNFNGLKDTVQCVRSLQRDGYPNKEIIVWDNGSKRNEEKELRSLFPEITVVRSEENFFYAGGNNKAAEKATGDILVFLNNDTEVTHGWIQPLLAFLTKNPDVGACQPKILSWHDHTRFDYAGGCGGFFDCLGFPYTRGRVMTTLEIDQGQYNGQKKDLDWVSGACFAVRSDVFFKAGKFDEDLGMYTEELDLSWRIKNLGFVLGCNAESIIYHKGGRSWVGTTDGPCFYRHRNNLLILLKNMPMIALIRLLLLRLPLEILAPIFYMSTGNPSSAYAPIRALWSFLKLRKKFAAKRYKISHLMTLSGKPFLLWQYYVRKHRTYASFSSTLSS